MPKTCSKCDQPLGRGPRVRDSRGRLLCLGCHSGGNPAPARAGSGTCLGCGRPVGARTVICTGCGRNQRTGEQVATTRKRTGTGVTISDGIAATVLHPLAVAAWGSGVVLALFLIARSSADLAALFAFTTVLAWLGLGLVILYKGWQDSGLIGILYAHRFPLGGLLEDPSGRRLTAFWLLAIATVCSLLLLVQHPQVAERLPAGGTRPSRAAHDMLLPPN